MAEHVTASLLAKLILIVADEARRHVSTPASVKGELEKLECKLKTIQPFLEDAYNKQFTSKSNIKDWISRVHQIIYDAEDIIIMHKAKIREVDAVTKLGKVCNKVFCYFSRLKLSIFDDTASKIKQVIRKLNFVYEETVAYGLIDCSQSQQHLKECLSRKHSISSDITEMNIFQEDEKSIVQWLMKSHNNEAEEKTRAMAIVGMWGIGKTTLARKIYKNPSIIGHFHKSMWICVSEKPDAVELLKQILDDLVGKGSGANEIMGLNPLSREITKHLKGKRFLLVIDDAWEYNWWRELNGMLQQCAPGSKVLITTRDTKIKESIDIAHVHTLNCSEDYVSWCLFVNEVLMDKETEEELDSLMDIGKVIVERCDGLPLALSVVGRMLKRSRRRSDWQKVADGPFFVGEAKFVDRFLVGEAKFVDHHHNEVFFSIALSYMRLSSTLKRCLTYCSIFPKGYKMDKRQLMMLWLAEDFIPEVEGQRLEKSVGDCLATLIHCSLIQPFGDHYCTLHDIVHDFASYMRGKENANLSSSTTADWNQARALCLTEMNQLATDITRYENLRTLVMQRQGHHHTSLRADILLKLKWLRVVDLSYCHLYELPDSLGDLVLLRYLSLFGNYEITALPESISRLRSLETLDLRETSIRKLPGSTWRLRALRHLHLEAHNNSEQCASLKYMPRKMGKLALLQTLSYLVVGSYPESRNGCSIRELQLMNNLEGSLLIDHIERVQTKEEAKGAELDKKAKLHELKLVCGGSQGQTAEKIEGIFEKLRPHKDLKALEVLSYGGNKFPAWTDTLSRLERVSLRNNFRLKTLPSFKYSYDFELEISEMSALEDLSSGVQLKEPMPCPRSLTIERCPNLSALPVGFDKLESIVIRYMEGIKKWPLAKPMPRLQSLVIMHCSELRGAMSINGFPKLRRLHINGMLKLEKWTQRETLPCLQSLKITNCPNLRSVPEVVRHTELHELVLGNLPKLVLTIPSLASLENLRELRLDGLPNFHLQEKHKFLQMLKTATRLESLRLEGFSSLGAIENMNQLKELELWNCPNLVVSTANVIKHHHLPKLRGMRFFSSEYRSDFISWHGTSDCFERPKNECAYFVSEFSFSKRVFLLLDIDSVDKLRGLANLGSRIDVLVIKIRSLPSPDKWNLLPEWVKHLQNLQGLVITSGGGGSQLTHLPEWLGDFSQLQRLKLEGLTSLWRLPDGLGRLSQLRELQLVRLRELNSLPEGLVSLPNLSVVRLEDLPRLTSLSFQMMKKLLGVNCRFRCTVE